MASSGSVPLPAARGRSGAHRAWLVFAAALLLVGAAHHAALASWVLLWLFGGHTFGLIAAAGAAWFCWRLLPALRDVPLAPDLRALAVLLPLGLALSFARLADLQAAQLVMLIAAAAACAWAVLGWAATRIVLVPLSVLSLALPVWEYARPILQELTVRATVFVLQTVGIPVFVDETYIHTPTRTLLILSECSGLQYFQAAVTLGVVYSYLNLRSVPMRLALVCGFAALAIVGNWLRVDVLMVLPPLPELAHLAVGWTVFLIAMVPLFALAPKLARIEERWLPAAHAAGAARAEEAPVPRVSRTLASAAVVVGCLALAPVLAAQAALRAQPGADGLPALAVQPPWSGPYAPRFAWRPAFIGADEEWHRAYRAGEAEVVLYMAYYASQRQGAEAVNELNRLYDPSEWVIRGGVAGSDYERVALDDAGGITVAETRLRHLHAGSELLVWRWFEMAGRPAARPWCAKLQQITGLLQGRGDARVIALGVEAHDVDRARATLRDFLLHARLVPAGAGTRQPC